MSAVPLLIVAALGVVYLVLVLTHADHLESRMEREKPVPVVLDLTMPVIDTLATLNTLRRKGEFVPRRIRTMRGLGHVLVPNDGYRA